MKTWLLMNISLDLYKLVPEELVTKDQLEVFDQYIEFDDLESFIESFQLDEFTMDSLVREYRNMLTNKEAASQNKIAVLGGGFLNEEVLFLISNNGLRVNPINSDD